MRRQQRELLLSISPPHLDARLTKLANAEVRRVDEPSALEWIGAERLAREAVEALLSRPETDAYAAASVELRSAELRKRTLELVADLSYSWPRHEPVQQAHNAASKEWTRVVRSTQDDPQPVEDLIDALLVAELVATDDWTFSPLQAAIDPS